MSCKIEALPDSYAKLGEGPHWDIETQSLYYIDLIGPTLYRYDFKLNKIYKAKLENEKFASFIIPIENKSNQFVIGCGHFIKIVEWDGKSDKCNILSDYCSVETNSVEFGKNRFNDGKCDPFGRLYAGTMHSEDFKNHKCGSLYLCNSEGQNKNLISNVGISNGLTWDVKRKKFYFIDSLAHNVKVFDYDEENGNLLNEKIFIDFSKNEEPTTIPDGMTIDQQGNIYVALYNGSKISKVNPNGNIELEVQLDCKEITSLAFGGPNLDILFVTTAALQDQQPSAGQTFKILNLGAQGLPMNKLKM